MASTIDNYEIIAYKTAKAWRSWLTKHHADTDGVWVRIYKKASGVATVTYTEALDEALCFGWIDGLVRSYDAESYIQKFTPRRKNSLWSKRNIEHIARLTEAGRMMPAGIAEVERAQQDGRWQAAYDKPSEMVIPDDFLKALAHKPKAKELFETLNKTNRYAIAWRLQTAKTPETRQRRMDKIITTLEGGQPLH